MPRIGSPRSRSLLRNYIESKRKIERGNAWSIGHDNFSIPLSYSCGEGKPVPFSGSIQNSDDRVAYYGKLMNALEARGGR